MPKYINGPFNYIQLTGFVGTIKKDITIFMDVHLDLDNQTRCDSFDSIDISQYLYNLIKHTKIPLDFFLEVRKEQLNEPITDKRDIYISEVIEMFKSEFIVEKDNVKYSKSNDNVRLHYLDIRDHLDFIQLINILKKEIYPRLNSLKSHELNQTYKLRILEEIKQCINKIKIKIINFIEKKINIQHNPELNFVSKSQEYYLNKIINNYSNESVKKIINNIFNKFLINFNGDFNKLTTEINMYIYNYTFDIDNILHLTDLFSLYTNLRENIFQLYGVVTDIYFLRRILDKDYIENVITYCGRNHALNYIYFLVKYCNYTITKIYNTNGLTLDDITKKIKETNEINKIYNLFLLEGEKPKQCVEIVYGKYFLLGW
jgi:hypothetical protein